MPDRSQAITNGAGAKFWRSEEAGSRGCFRAGWSPNECVSEQALDICPERIAASLGSGLGCREVYKLEGDFAGMSVSYVILKPVRRD